MAKKVFTEMHKGMAKLPSAFEGIRFDVPRFVNYIKPNGFLCDHPACHAVFYYNLTARLSYEENELGFGLQMEGEGFENVLWNRSNFRQSWETISMMYGVTEADMVRHWQCVDMQFFAMGKPGLPDEERYRFNRVPQVDTNGNSNSESNGDVRADTEQRELSGESADIAGTASSGADGSERDV